MRIQIIEDNPDIGELFSGFFKSKQHEVILSSDGLAGITEAVDFRPEVVLLDIMMPEMSGFQFLDALRNNTSLHPVVIVCSNLSDQQSINEALAHGADEYLRKSDYSGINLVDKVEEVREKVLKKRQYPNGK